MLKKFKLPGGDQILAELIQAGGQTLVSVIHKLINYIWNKDELPDQWKDSIIVPIHKKGYKTDCNNYHGINKNIETSFEASKEVSLEVYIEKTKYMLMSL
jgi:hypothetical protein